MAVLATTTSPATTKVSGLPNPYDITAGTPGQYPDTDQGLPYPPVNPSSTQRIAQMARLRLRDLPRPFLARQTCSGAAWRFELPVENVSAPNLQVVLTDTSQGGTTALVLGTDYVLDEHGGTLVFNTAPPGGLLMVAQGTYYRDYLPAEMDLYVRTAYIQHTYGEQPAGEVDTGYPPPPGPPPLGTTGQPVAYGSPAPMMVNEVEEYPISILVTIMALWDMAVGLYRITQSRLRRVSRTTKRLVPIYRPQEYDNLVWPQREMPPVDVVQQMYTYQGTWDSTRPYQKNDLIDYESRRYLCLQPHTNIDPTRDVDPTTGSGYYWAWSTINTGWVGWW